MSLATSCPSCGTVFKVVEDQLKISEGWVRCGHCHDVFNALEGLFDLDRRDSTMQELRTLPGALETRPTPREEVAQEASTGFDSPAPAASKGWPTGAALEAPAQREATPSVAAAPVLAAPVEPVPAGMPGTAELQDTQTAAREAPGTSPDPAAPYRSPVQDDDEPEDTLVFERSIFPEREEPLRSEASVSDTVELETPATARVEQVTAAEIQLDPTPTMPAFAPSTESDEDLPTFVKQARREARWSSRSVRVALSLTSLALAGGLAAQVLLHHRDRLHAACPTCRAPVAWLAELAGLPIRPPIVVEAVEVDNAVLVQPPGVDGYRLTVQVRNRAEHVVASPHMELSLTDATGTLLIRRVLSPTEFGQADQLSGGAEKSWTLEFHSADKRVAGYTVAAFYP